MTPNENTYQQLQSPDDRAALLVNLEYAGGGMYRDSRVPKGQAATVLHGKQLLDLVKTVLADERQLLNTFAQRVWEKRWSDSPVADEAFGLAAEIRSGNLESLKRESQT